LNFEEIRASGQIRKYRHDFRGLPRQHLQFEHPQRDRWQRGRQVDTSNPDLAGRRIRLDGDNDRHPERRVRGARQGIDARDRGHRERQNQKHERPAAHVDSPPRQIAQKVAAVGHDASGG
jgi:hypothetical protein